MNSNIPFRYRYAILEFSRAVELILGGKWKKDDCEEELLRRGWDHLVDDVLWLLTIRGNRDVAHPSKRQKISEADTYRARTIANMVILEETGYNVSLA